MWSQLDSLNVDLCYIWSKENIFSLFETIPKYSGFPEPVSACVAFVKSCRSRSDLLIQFLFFLKSELYIGFAAGMGLCVFVLLRLSSVFVWPLQTSSPHEWVWHGGRGLLPADDGHQIQGFYTLLNHLHIAVMQWGQFISGKWVTKITQTQGQWIFMFLWKV